MAQQKTWTDANGVIHFVNEMHTSHLENTINMLEQRIDGRVKDVVAFYKAYKGTFGAKNIKRESVLNVIMTDEYPVYFEMMKELKRRKRHQAVVDKVNEHFKCEECKHRSVCEQLELLFGEPNVEVHGSIDSLLRSIMEELIPFPSEEDLNK